MGMVKNTMMVKNAMHIACEDLGITQEQFATIPQDVQQAILKYWAEPGFEEVTRDIDYSTFVVNHPLNSIDKAFHKEMGRKNANHPADDYSIAGGGIVDDDAIS